MDLTADHFTIRGVFRSLSFKGTITSWDFALASFIAVFGTFYYNKYVPDPHGAVAIAGDFLAISGALFGVIIAGFAIATSLVDERYARSMERANSHPYNVLRHFLVEGVLLVASLVAAVVFRAIALPVHHASATAEHWLLGIAAFLFFWALFGALQVMRLVLGIAVSRASAFTGDGDGDAGTARRAS